MEASRVFLILLASGDNYQKSERGHEQIVCDLSRGFVRGSLTWRETPLRLAKRRTTIGENK
jgi:hypothetical protein